MTQRFPTVLPDAETVKAEEALSIAQLFLRWKYDTAQRIREKYYLPLQKYEDQSLLIVKLTDIYYLDTPLTPDDYQGFLLRLEPLLFLENYSYGEMISEFSFLFVLKRDVSQAEETNREFAALPAGDRTKLCGEICTAENLHMLGPQIFAKLFTRDNDKLPPIANMLIPERHVWPWLGPVITTSLGKKELKDQNTKDFKDYLIEVAHFLKAARQLGQEDPYCLGKMVRHRYPKIGNQDLVELIEPWSSRNKGAIKTQAWRWVNWE